ncbi:hypothetical protein FKP32DRAFT_1586240 [Trametes sanguinea]|nr:hypothetical protein FKP32DRAFT_1586240 [Trametes sanguinea]
MDPALLAKRHHPDAPQPRFFLTSDGLSAVPTTGPTCNIPLGCVRTRDVLEKIPVRFPDGRQGIKLSQFTSVNRYTKAPHPVALTVVGADLNMDAKIKAGAPVLYASSAFPEDIWTTMPIVRPCFTKTISKLVEARPVRKAPEQNFTFAHLLTNVASRQWTWCYNVVNLVEDASGNQSSAARLRETLHIVAICSGWDEQRKMIVWYPELELRIPEAWIAA